MTPRLSFLPLLALLLLASACVGQLKQEPPARKFYLLEAPRPAKTSPAPAFALGATVRDIRVAPPFDTRSLTYRLDGARFEADYYHLFLTEPGRMITQVVRQWLGDADVFAYVVPPGSDADYRWVVEAHVTELYGDYSAEPGAVLGLQVFVLDDAADGYRVLLRREYRETVPLTGSDPEALIDGLDAALSTILTRLEADLRAVAN